MNTGGAFVTFVTVTPMTNTTSSLYSPNQNTGRGDASTTSAVTLQQLAEEVTLHPTSNSLATCPGAVQLWRRSARAGNAGRDVKRATNA